jgi:homogentisate 1,2-dioxygenase
MHHYWQGKPTKQGHKGIPEGYFEEEQGRKGFFGPVSHLIKKKPSTRWTDIEGDLRPHMYDLNKLEQNSEQWQRVLYNSDCSLYNLWILPSDSLQETAFRNADGDLCYFCHEGAGKVLTEYGLLEYDKGTYLVIPKCVTHSILPEAKSRFFVIESHTSAYTEPERGIVGRHAPYDIQAIGKPDLEAQNTFVSSMSKEPTKVGIRRKGRLTTFTYAESVYDTVGWKGDLFPFTLHINDFMPLMSHRVHLPPSAHTTFVARGFVICTFAARPAEMDEDALKVPFYHQNMDYDEVIFYHAGDFFSRDNLDPGMITLHPAGFPHGPHPKAVRNMNKGTKTFNDEWAVMVDTWQPLEIDDTVVPTEFKEYWASWKE